MSSEVKNPPQQSVAALVSGIVADFQRLIEQQFQLTRREIEVEIRLRAEAGAVFALGMSVLFITVVLICLTIVHGLHWMSSPPGTDPARIPLWACHGLIALLLAAIGGITSYTGRVKFRAIEPFQNPASEILQEPVQWTTHPK